MMLEVKNVYKLARAPTNIKTTPFEKFLKVRNPYISRFKGILRWNFI